MAGYCTSVRPYFNEPQESESIAQGCNIQPYCLLSHQVTVYPSHCCIYFILFFDWLLSPFTWRLSFLNSLLLLLAFIITSQSYSSCHSLCLFALLIRYFRYQPSSSLASLTPLRFLPRSYQLSSLAPKPSPSFSSLAVRFSLLYCKRREAR